MDGGSGDVVGASLCLRFLSDVKTLVSVSEADIRIVALADVTVVQGEPSQFQIEVPAGFEITGATGASIESSEFESGVLTLKVTGATQSPVPDLHGKIDRRHQSRRAVSQLQGCPARNLRSPCGRRRNDRTHRRGSRRPQAHGFQGNESLLAFARAFSNASRISLSQAAERKTRPCARMDALSG